LINKRHVLKQNGGEAGRLITKKMNVNKEKSSLTQRAAFASARHDVP